MHSTTIIALLSGISALKPRHSTRTPKNTSLLGVDSNKLYEDKNEQVDKPVTTESKGEKIYTAKNSSMFASRNTEGDEDQNDKKETSRQIKETPRQIKDQAAVNEAKNTMMTLESTHQLPVSGYLKTSNAKNEPKTDIAKEVELAKKITIELTGILTNILAEVNADNTAAASNDKKQQGEKDLIDFKVIELEDEPKK